MSAITTHVLDTARGRPAAGVPITLEVRATVPPDAQAASSLDGQSAQSAQSAGWTMLGRGVTDNDGRLRTLLPAGAPLAEGFYRLTFDTGSYFAGLGLSGFYPEVIVIFEIQDPAQHYHVPLLLSPYGYSTYRGS